MSPFIIKEKVDKSFFEVIFKTEPKFNAVVEINNLLASKPVKSISAEDIETIANRYKLNIRKAFRDHIQSFYSIYLSYCFEDKKLSKKEIDDLQHLKQILCLTDKETEQLNSIISEKIYTEETRKALTDGRLTEEEKQFLEEIKSNLSISEATAKKIYADLAQDYFKNFFNEIVSDNRISAEEEKELQEIAKSLGIEVNMDDKARSTFDKMRLLWLIENDEIPVIKVNLPLVNSEKCYFKTSAQWMLETPDAKKYFDKTLVEGQKNIQEFNHEIVSIKPEDNLKLIDKGILYLTNKRIIFIGGQGGKTVPIDKIMVCKPYLNGFEIQADGGKQFFIYFSEHIDVFSALLMRISRHFR